MECSAEVLVTTSGLMGILDHVTASHESFIIHRGKPRCQVSHRNGLIETYATKLLVIRPHRTETRAIKRRPKNFPLLTSPRGEYVEIPHRGNGVSVQILTEFTCSLFSRHATEPAPRISRLIVGLLVRARAHGVEGDSPQAHEF